MKIFVRYLCKKVIVALDDKEQERQDKLQTIDDLQNRKELEYSFFVFTIITIYKY